MLDVDSNLISPNPTKIINDDDYSANLSVNQWMIESKTIQRYII